MNDLFAPTPSVFLKNLGRQLRLHFIPFSIILSSLAYLAIGDHFLHPLMNLHWNHNQEPHLLRIANWLSRWCDFWPGGLCFTLTIALIGLLFNQREWKMIGALALLTGLLSGGFNMALKKTAGRPRPATVQAQQVPDRFLGPHHNSKFESFASGHTTTAFAVAIMIYFLRRKVGIFLILWAAAIAWSRMYVGAHYLGDVIAGIWIGHFFALVVYQSYKKT